jgi:transcriptional regulator with XRE-family HTH domain
MSAGQLIRQARHDAGLTQQQLARRLGVTQATLAKLERNGSNPTIRTLERVLRATGRRLELRLARPVPSVDESLLREALRSSPAERIAAAERLTAEAQLLAAAGARARHAS